MADRRFFVRVVVWLREHRGKPLREIGSLTQQYPLEISLARLKFDFQCSISPSCLVSQKSVQGFPGRECRGIPALTRPSLLDLLAGHGICTSPGFDLDAR
jgi:hypothetical protein